MDTSRDHSNSNGHWVQIDQCPVVCPSVFVVCAIVAPVGSAFTVMSTIGIAFSVLGQH